MISDRKIFYYCKADLKGMLYIDPIGYETFGSWITYMDKAQYEMQMNEGQIIELKNVNTKSMFYKEISRHRLALFYVSGQWLYGPITRYNVLNCPNEFDKIISAFKIHFKNYPPRFLISDLENEWSRYKKIISQ